MSTNILIASHLSKEEKYKQVIPIIHSLVEQETDYIANMANMSSVLKEVFNWFWVGFYLVNQQELVLGPFQGTVACTRIGFNKGVCGKAWQQKKTVVVPDVLLFPGHIACSSISQSEIVVPVWIDKTIIGVLDIDSQYKNQFDEIDKLYLEKIVNLLQ